MPSKSSLIIREMMLCFGLCFLLLVFFWLYFLSNDCFKRNHIYFKKTIQNKKSNKPYKNRKKPDWVVKKVLYLKAISNRGCGSVASSFNQLYGHKETVSKTFVYKKLKAHQYEMLLLKRKLKQRKPKVIPVGQTWGMDLTSVTLNQKQRLILGIVDHGSRLNLKLAELPSKHSANIVLQTIQVIRTFGFPKSIRTDNESCFCSRWMKACLWLLGIKHQRIPVAAPWCNGRIERFFGSFKERFKQVIFADTVHLQSELNVFRAWYNVIRPHSHLGGLTPTEVFKGKLNRHKPALEVSDWDGVLTGYYFPD